MGLLDTIKSKLEEYRSNRPVFDPSVFKDPFALEIDWTPAKGGGTNIFSHTIGYSHPSRLEFRARYSTYLFSGVFLVAGILVMVLMTYGGISKQEYEMLYFGLPFGAIFAAVGGGLMYSWTKPRVFDQDMGFYWIGKSPQRHLGITKTQCPLCEIYAIQIISEYVSSSNSNGGSSSYRSYEINLVLKDKQRMNVIDHSHIEHIRKDAKQLSTFLKVPLWDKTNS